MTRRCTICNHSNRNRIDRSLVKGTPLRTIADRWSVSKTALIRHREKHLPASLVASKKAKEVTDADRLIANICNLRKRAHRILNRAEEAGDDRTALSAIRESRNTLELLAKLLGELQTNTNINVLVTPEYQQMRTSILDALGPFPEARIAGADALKRLNGASR